MKKNNTIFYLIALWIIVFLLTSMRVLFADNSSKPPSVHHLTDMKMPNSTPLLTTRGRSSNTDTLAPDRHGLTDGARLIRPKEYDLSSDINNLEPAPIPTSNSRNKKGLAHLAKGIKVGGVPGDVHDIRREQLKQYDSIAPEESAREYSGEESGSGITASYTFKF